MTNTTAPVLEQPMIEEAQGLPNKFIYPEFAGFAGEERLHEIVTLILPTALFRTWEIFERKHAYENDCYQSLGTITKKAGRTARTIKRHIATFMARNMLVLRPGFKFKRRPDGSVYKKGVTIKDFSGLYALAHEYYLWLRDEEQYLEPEYENLVHIQNDLHLKAKLCRFENYRRLLENQRDPFAQIEEDRRFTEYDPDALYDEEEHAEHAEENASGQNVTKSLPKEVPNEASKVSHKRINEKAYVNSQERDSSESDEALETGRGADATRTGISKPGARDYTKQVRGDKTGTHSTNESETNPVPLSPKNVPPGAGKTRVSDENAPEVQSARGAMTAFGIVPGQSARHQAEELPPPPKHPLARSFVHEVSTLFGDLNEKGSKTDVERRIEDFELNQPIDVLLCLVRAYVVARDTEDEDVRRRRPDGKPNRMPLFTRMFEKFARALGPGSRWQYTYQQMSEDIAADGRLEQWVSEHQTELAGEGSDQAEASRPPLAFAEELTEEEAGEDLEETFPEEERIEEFAEDEEEEFTEENEEFIEEDGEPEKEETEVPGETFGEEQEEAPELTPGGGWKTRELAYDWAAYVVNELATNGYENLEVSVLLPADIDLYQVSVQHPDGRYYCLVCRENIRSLVSLARNRKLFPAVETDGQAVAGDE
jgi:hypothetical protein